jgi:DNA-binding transcriptional LysR family regulator
MMDWDEVRYFLAVAREGSVRTGAERLGVNHSTVLRRIALLEQQLGAQLFEKMPSGYRLTAAGEEVVQFAEDMDVASNQLQARVFGRDHGVRGRLRATMASVLASHLLMPRLVEFAQLYPDVEMEILSSDEPLNLTNREAEVALRAVYDRDALPNNLHGLKGPEISSGVYISRELLSAWRAGTREPVRRIVKNRYGDPDWARQSDIPTSEILFRTTDAAAQIVAVRQGLGVTLLPCFVGDTDPFESSRIPPPGAWRIVAAHPWRDPQVQARPPV